MLNKRSSTLSFIVLLFKSLTSSKGQLQVRSVFWLNGNEANHIKTFICERHNSEKAIISGMHFFIKPRAFPYF